MKLRNMLSERSENSKGCIPRDSTSMKLKNEKTNLGIEGHMITPNCAYVYVRPSVLDWKRDLGTSLGRWK